jgi:hypothetical protein
MTVPSSLPPSQHPLLLRLPPHQNLHNNNNITTTYPTYNSSAAHTIISTTHFTCVAYPCTASPPARESHCPPSKQSDSPLTKHHTISMRSASVST